MARSSRTRQPGLEKLLKDLEKLARQLKDPRRPNQAVSLKLYQFVIRNIDSGGQLVGGWAPLAESTKRYKKRIGKERPGIVTGQMRASFTNFYNRETGGVRSNLAHAGFFDQGTVNMPARRLTPTVEEIVGITIPIYKDFIDREAREIFKSPPLASGKAPAKAPPRRSSPIKSSRK